MSTPKRCRFAMPMEVAVRLQGGDRWRSFPDVVDFKPGGVLIPQFV
jgi:hypothetical protein